MTALDFLPAPAPQPQPEPGGTATRAEHRPRRRRRRRHHSRPPRQHPPHAATTLPFDARALSRRELSVFEPLLAYYLDLHKGLSIDCLPELELRGRWKRFVGMWNRGELAEGWYDPEMFQRVAHDYRKARGEIEESPANRTTGETMDREKGSQDASSSSSSSSSSSNSSNDDDDGFGPALPPSQQSSLSNRHPSRRGPGIPTLLDLEARAELDAEAAADRAGDLRAARRADRRLQKEALDELVPRAEPGTRERRLEKRRAVNDKMRAFRDKSPGGGEDGVGGGDLLGGEDGVKEYKRALVSAQKRKSEREMRREEMARALAAEHEERVRAYRAREEKTVEMLRELAKQRFG